MGERREAGGAMKFTDLDELLQRCSNCAEVFNFSRQVWGVELLLLICECRTSGT